jgi:hypothetical protein
MFAKNRFVAADGLMSSTDGLTWSAPIPPPGGTGRWTGLFVVDDVFYAVGTTDPLDEKNGVIGRSVDGLSWTVVATMAERLSAVGGKAGLLVACSYFGDVWTSTNGADWTRADGKPLSGLPLAFVAWVGDSLVAATLTGSIVLSDDGITWTKDEFASSGTMFGLTAGNGQVLAYGAGGVIWEVGGARFIRQPVDSTVPAGSPVTLTSSATGKEPLTYQWEKDGAPITGAKSKSYAISAVKSGDAGNYRVIVSNATSSSTSSTAALQVTSASTPPSPSGAPTITTQPQSQTVNPGAAVTFTVAATGNAPLTYQWQKDTAPIAGATGTNYTIASAYGTDHGTYSVVVTNNAGSIVSNGVVLTVTAAASHSRLVNISTRAYATTNNGITIGGFVVKGGAPKQVLMRAVGPSLTKQGLATSEVLADPMIELHHGADTLATNDNWSDNPNAGLITATATRIGANALDASDTKSAALLMILDPGVYTFIAKGKNNSSGILLLEVYDADSGESLFVNIASRAQCTTGNGVSIGGFVISGNVAKQVLMRAVGPTLTSQGLSTTEVLPDPTIELHQGAATIATNDNWADNANTAQIVSVGARIGATPFASSDMKSSALLMTLTPGVYSFVVRGKNETPGIVLVEVYDAD